MTPKLPLFIVTRSVHIIPHTRVCIYIAQLVYMVYVYTLYHTYVYVCMSVQIHWVYILMFVCVCVCLDLYRGRREIVECINVFSETLRTSGQERDTEGGGAW